MKQNYRFTIALLTMFVGVIVFSVSAQAAPTASNVAVQGGSSTALPDDDLAATYDLTDAVTAGVAWYRNSSPMTKMYLPIEGGATNGLLDLSGNSHTVTAAGTGTAAAAWRATDGYSGTGAFQFGSAFWMNAGTIFPTQSSYTKMAWIKRTGSGSNNIMSGTSSHVWYASSSSKQNRMSAGHNGNFTIVQDPDSLDLNVWYFVALTFEYSTGEMIMYKDGVEVDRGTASVTERELTDNGLYIGAFANSSPWAGLIDEARLYDYPLSPEQVAALYAGEDIDNVETTLGDTWYADVTPFSATEMGATVSSNTVTIVTGVPAVSGIPDQSVPEGSSFTTINLDSYVTDPNHTAAEMTWTSTGAVELSVSIVNRVATITISDADWFGTETITFRATDPDFLYDEDAAIFEVTAVNDPPTVGDIPDQLVVQGTPFAVIDLDAYITDIDNTPGEMIWTSSGESGLTVTIDNFAGTATVAVSSPDWYGSETITFRATDPGALFAEDAATFTVDADPAVEAVTVDASSPNPLMTDNLFCTYSLTGNATAAAIAWYRNSVPEMVLYMPSEGGPATGLLDYSGNGVTVSPYSDPAFDATGGHDGSGAWILDGNDHFDCGSIFPTQSSYTKALWLIRTGTGSNNIMSGASGHVFYASSSSQQNHMASGHNGAYTIVRDPDSLDLNVWCHAAVTFDYATGEMILYRDGVEVDRGTATAAQRELTDAALYVGAFAASSQWRGSIDDARVYDRALSADQILALYNGGDTIVAAETQILDQWYAEVTPFADSEVGATVISNSILIGYVNQPPALSTIDPQTVDVGDPLSFGVTAADPDPQPLPALTATGVPEGALFTDHGNGTGTFEWTPDYDQFGDFEVVVYATDDSTAYDSQVVTVTAIPDTTPPDVSVAEPDNDSLTTNTFMNLRFDISDENPMTVRVRGGADPTPTKLLSVNENAGSGSIDYLWWCQPLVCLVGETVGLWCCDNGTGETTSDASPDGNDGTLMGGTAWTAIGHHGYALVFDGYDDYVVVPDAPSLDVDPSAGALTLEAWIHPDAAGDGILRSIIAKRAFGRSRTVNYELLLNFDRHLMFAEGEGSSYIHLSSVLVPADEWSHVAFTLDAASRVGRFYLNGVFVDSLLNIDIGPVHDEPLYIGAAGPSAEPFMGMIDEVRLTKRALTPTEIADGYDLRHGVHYWQVEVEDASGNLAVSEVHSFAVHSPEWITPTLGYPAATSGPLYDMLPTFNWSNWVGPSPFDTVYFQIHLGLDNAFSFEAVFDSIPGLQFAWVDSLDFGRQYWWKIDAWAETDTGLIGTTTPVDSFWSWTLGDLNQDNSLNVSDLTALVAYLFQGGDPLDPLRIGDLDASCAVNVADLTYLVAFLFQGGPDPQIGCE